MVTHPTTGTLLRPFLFLDHWVLDIFVGFIPIGMFYFSLHGAGPFPFLLASIFTLYAAFSSAEYYFLCFLDLVLAFSSFFLFPPDSFREFLELLCCKASCSMNISSCLQSSLCAIIQALSVAYSSVDSRRSASLRICCSTICHQATPLIPTWVLWFSISRRYRSMLSL